MGYDLAEDGRTLIENEDEQKVIRLIRRLRKRNLSLRKICAELEHRGIHTKQGRSQWTPRAVKLIIDREAA